MSLSSMTGFARASGSHSASTWVWEIKSVNGKAFDARLRLPQGFEHLEIPAKQILAQHFKRGNLQVNLSLQNQSGEERITINRDVLEQYLVLAEELRNRTGALPPSSESLLALRGVVESKAELRSEEEQAEIDKEIMVSFNQAVLALSKNRDEEGAKLFALLKLQLDQIETCRTNAINHPSRKIDVIKQKLKDQVAQLLELHSFDEQRLHQEAVMLATKADIQEELDRLGVHISAARDLLKSKEPVGRKFDFLAQEFNREANTLCSKANDAALTQIGLDLKTVIDQMREQVQNIE
jgi:uncharacterized protein (TIGR00255 family)